MRAQDVHVDIVDADTRRCMRIQSGACRRCGGCANKAVYVDESVHAVDAVGVGAERRMWRWKCILTRPMVQTMGVFRYEAVNENEATVHVDNSLHLDTRRCMRKPIEARWSVPTQGVHMVNAMNAESMAVHLEKGGDTS